MALRILTGILAPDPAHRRAGRATIYFNPHHAEEDAVATEVSETGAEGDFTERPGQLVAVRDFVIQDKDTFWGRSESDWFRVDIEDWNTELLEVSWACEPGAAIREISYMVSGEVADSEPRPMLRVDSIGLESDLLELRNLIGAAGNLVMALGFWEAHDGGGGVFQWIEGPVTRDLDDWGTTIVPGSPLGPLPSGYWKRLYSGPLNVKWFGAKGNGIDNDKDAIVKADEVGNTMFPSGDYLVDDLVLTKPPVFWGNVVFKPDPEYTGDGGHHFVLKLKGDALKQSSVAGGFTIDMSENRDPHLTGLVIQGRHWIIPKVTIAGGGVSAAELAPRGAERMGLLFTNDVETDTSATHNQIGMLMVSGCVTSVLFDVAPPIRVYASNNQINHAYLYGGQPFLYHPSAPDHVAEAEFVGIKYNIRTESDINRYHMNKFNHLYIHNMKVGIDFVYHGEEGEERRRQGGVVGDFYGVHFDGMEYDIRVDEHLSPNITLNLREQQSKGLKILPYGDERMTFKIDVLNDRQVGYACIKEKGTADNTSERVLMEDEDGNVAAYLLPPYSLYQPDKYVEIVAYARTANNDRHKTIRLYFGGYPLLTLSGPFNGRSFVLKSRVYRTGVQTQKAFSEVHFDDGEVRFSTSEHDEWILPDILDRGEFERLYLDTFTHEELESMLHEDEDLWPEACIPGVLSERDYKRLVMKLAPRLAVIPIKITGQNGEPHANDIVCEGITVNLF